MFIRSPRPGALVLRRNKERLELVERRAPSPLVTAFGMLTTGLFAAIAVYLVRHGSPIPPQSGHLIDDPRLWGGVAGFGLLTTVLPYVRLFREPSRVLTADSERVVAGQLLSWPRGRVAGVFLLVRLVPTPGSDASTTSIVRVMLVERTPDPDATVQLHIVAEPSGGLGLHRRLRQWCTDANIPYFGRYSDDTPERGSRRDANAAAQRWAEERVARMADG